jgi:hypothetical protein
MKLLILASFLKNWGVVGTANGRLLRQMVTTDVEDETPFMSSIHPHNATDVPTEPHTAPTPSIDNSDGGPWYKILEYTGDHYEPTKDKVGELSSGVEAGNTFAKLSDEEINELAGPEYYVRFKSADNAHFLYAHVKDLKYNDTFEGMGYGGTNMIEIGVNGSLEKIVFAEKQIHLTGIDSHPASGDGAARWYTDIGGSVAAWKSGGWHEYDNGVRSFNMGVDLAPEPKYKRRSGVTIWVKPLGVSTR